VARRLANGDGRKRPRDRTILKYATEIWQPRSPAPGRDGSQERNSDDIASHLPGRD
jgi:hypothetical protein